MEVDGVTVKTTRERQALSLRELAARSGVGASAISEIERGLRQPHPSTIRKLAAALGVEPRDLLKPPTG